MPTNKRINLLPKKGGDGAVVDRYVNWALSIGRWIVVLTLFATNCAFLSRFYFDTKLDNLFDELRQKKAIINSVASFEENYRSTQDKIALVKSVLTEQKQFSPLLVNISQSLPEGVVISQVGMGNKELSISGLAADDYKINSFAKALSKTNVFEQISIGNIVKNEEETDKVKYIIQAEIK